MPTRSNSGPWGACVAVLLLAAGSGGCLSSFLGADRATEDDRFYLGAFHDSGVDLTSVPAAPPVTEDGFWGDVEKELGRISDGLVHRPTVNPLVDVAAVRAQPGYVPAVPDGEGGALCEEDVLLGLARSGRTEMVRMARRAVSVVLRRQPIYREVRAVLRYALSGGPITHLEPGPVLEDPEVDHSHGASRLFSGFPDRGLLRAPDLSDVDSSIQAGVRPKLGIRWMRFYRFSWEPRGDEIVHRLEYAVGPVGVGAAYRVREGRATEVGGGMQLPLGPMSVVTLSASRSLYGADAEEDGEPGAQRVLAELAWRF